MKELMILKSSWDLTIHKNTRRKFWIFTCITYIVQTMDLTFCSQLKLQIYGLSYRMELPNVIKSFLTLLPQFDNRIFWNQWFLSQTTIWVLKQWIESVKWNLKKTWRESKSLRNIFCKNSSFKLRKSQFQLATRFWNSQIC